MRFGASVKSLLSARAMYVKLFSKILDSSIWLEPPATCKVWITLLAAKDRNGFAQFASIKNLAHRAVVTLEQAEVAVECLSSPDPDSSNPENEGKRIEKVPGGFLILNSEFYRNLKYQIDKKELDRKYAEDYRSRKRQEKLTERQEKLTRTDFPVSVSVSVSESVSVKANKKRKTNIKQSSRSNHESFPTNLNNGDFKPVWEEWMIFRKGKKACKNFDSLFSKQLKWLSGFGAAIAIEMLNQSIRNDWQGIFELKTAGDRRFEFESKTARTIRKVNEHLAQIEKESEDDERSKGASQ